MTALQLTIKTGSNETPTSYASRLAARNCVSARVLAQDFLFSFQSVVDGEHDEIRRLADLGGVAAEPLIEHAVVKTDSGFSLRGQQLTKPTIRRARVVGCPFCLASDIRGSDLPPAIAVHGRSEWNVASIRSCRQHRASLVTLADALTPGNLHDFTRNVAPTVTDIAKLEDRAVMREPSGLETYLLDRLDGHANHPFLDRLPFYVAAWTTEIVGAVVEFGKKVKLDELTEDQRHCAGDAGFRFMRDGAAGLERCMSELKRNHTYKGPTSSDGPQAVYGKLYMTFAQGLHGPDYDPVREVMRTHILENFALGPDDEVFGKPVEQRRLHSIRTAAKSYQMHQKRLRKLVLAECGVEDQADKADRDILFDAALAERIFLREASLLTLKEVENYLNAPRPLASSLSDAGLIRRHAVGEGTTDRYLKSELDQLISSMYAKAVAVAVPGPEMCSVSEAAKRTNCTTVEVVRLIRDGGLDRVQHVHGKTSGILDLLVDVEEVRLRTRLPELDGLLPLDAARLLRTNQDVVKKLIKLGELQTITQKHPIKRNPINIVQTEEIKRFQRQYVSLFSLARERDIGLPKLKRQLAEIGIQPAFRDELGATFYRRSDVE
ncbi:hypothetical protein E0H22_15660 [Rhodopseudomonas boonkerdii]|uniref:TniQ family protein n=1 Tax=Rhodopseudomonas boonkerdii TaxID=475937 RepID=UPI001E2A7F0F|nr:TniQ family protein [Rhodopseudomonas boonkerdii]UGV26999.1 hypothetical protein E0H22_15660 [Rhodopseudomonas boonkerdii]